jgi:hypothetical protein
LGTDILIFDTLKQAKLPDVGKPLYAATCEAWIEYKITNNPPYPMSVVYPRGTLMQAFELRDVYKLHRPNPVARLELVSAMYAHTA